MSNALMLIALGCGVYTLYVLAIELQTAILTLSLMWLR